MSGSSKRAAMVGTVKICTERSSNLPRDMMVDSATMLAKRLA